jgi:hypothetical protein
MSVNVTERNGSDCKYVEIFTHRVGSIGASSRKTGRVPKNAGRYTKSNIFQKGSAGFKATLDLNRKVHQGHVSVYVKIVDLLSLRQQ